MQRGAPYQQLAVYYDAAEWTSRNPKLALGQIGVEIDTGRTKRGDGDNFWNDLSYIPAGAIHAGAIGDLDPADSIGSADLLLVIKPSIARVLTGTVATGALSDGGDGLGIRVGGLTGLTGTDFDPDADTAAIVSWLNTNKALIPADSVTDNHDDTFDIGFVAGTGSNSIEASSEDPNLTFEETTVGADPVAKSAGLGTQVSDAYAGSHSYQSEPVDLDLDPAAGTSVAGHTAFLSPFMGNIIGENLTKLFNYLGGLIGAYSVSGTNASVLPKGGVVGVLTDGTTTADGAIVAHMDGSDPSAETHARAAFAVTVANNNAASSFDYGLDLQFVPSSALNGNMSGTAQNAKYAKGAIRLGNDVVIFAGAGVPSNGTAGDNFAGKGSKYIDYTNGEEYINTGTITDSVWKKITHAA